MWSHKNKHTHTSINSPPVCKYMHILPTQELKIWHMHEIIIHHTKKKRRGEQKGTSALKCCIQQQQQQQKKRANCRGVVESGLWVLWLSLRRYA